MSQGLKIFLSAGEASGEHYGAELILAIRALEPGAEFFGLGGARMTRHGMRCLVRSEDVAVMGITEVIAHMPAIYVRYRRLKASLRREIPDLAILIDFPDVNLRLATELRRLGVPVAFFVSPQVWAWKKRRIARIRRDVSRMLVIFPFEEAFYRARGVQADFVGHPLADLPLPEIGREAFALENNLDPSKPWIGLLPGSRRKEVEAHLPRMIETARLLGENFEYLLPAAPTLGEAAIRSMLRQALQKSNHAVHRGVKERPLPISVVRDARAALFHSRASLVASGTATVEAALMGNPFVVVYRMTRLSYAVARCVIDVPHIAMVNLVAGRRAVPELIQDEFTPANAAGALRPLLEEGMARATMQSDLASVIDRLRAGGGRESAREREGQAAGMAIERVARIALRMARRPAAASGSRQFSLTEQKRTG